MRRGLVATAVVALVVAAFAPADAAPRAPFDGGVSVGGGVVDLATGRRLDQAVPAARYAGVTVLRYARGARYRVPLLLSVDDGAERVLVTSIRLATTAASVVRPAGVVIEQRTCCALTDPVPFGPMVVPGPVPAYHDLSLGIDIELCCTPPPADGWTEVLAGVDVGYEAHGMRRTVFVPFPRIQTVVVVA